MTKQCWNETLKKLFHNELESDNNSLSFVPSVKSPLVKIFNDILMNAMYTVKYCNFADLLNAFR